MSWILWKDSHTSRLSGLHSLAASTQFGKWQQAGILGVSNKMTGWHDPGAIIMVQSQANSSQAADMYKDGYHSDQLHDATASNARHPDDMLLGGLLFARDNHLLFCEDEGADWAVIGCGTAAQQCLLNILSKNYIARHWVGQRGCLPQMW